MIMATTIYKICTTRPNIESLFNFELCAKNDYLIADEKSLNLSNQSSITTLETVLFDQPSEIIFYRYEEFISWHEIFLRRNEIRPDIKYRLDELGLFEQKSVDMFGNGPKFNFLSLTHTERSEFESFEHWETYYNDSRKYLEERKNYNEICLNNVKEEISINGVNPIYNRFVFS
jgi:hypothetical protein